MIDVLGRHGYRLSAGTLYPILRNAGVHFRNDIVTGVGGKQIIVDDPSGNPIELFEPTLPEARLTAR
jgi:hypothetical protein